MPLSLRFAYHDTVVLGAFNPAIIQPAWVIKTGLLAENEGFIDVPVLGGGLVQCRVAGFTWAVTSERLVVTHEELGRPGSPGDLAAGILGKLPHTPTQAVGNNFRFEAPAADWPDSLRPQVGRELNGTRAAASSGRAVRSAMTRFIMDGPGEARVQVELADDGKRVVVSTNIHRRAPAAEQAAEGARQAAEDFKMILDLVRQLFEAEVSDARDS